MAFVYCFGHASTINPEGIDFAKVPRMELSFFLGSLIIILIFGSIAILISIASGKIGILVGTIGIAITINVLYLVAPAISKSQAQYLSSTYSVNMNSYRGLTMNGEMHNAVNASYVTNETGTLYYANQAAQHSTNGIMAYANVARQMTSVYKMFDNTSEIEGNSGYGENVNYHYSINDKQPMLQHNDQRLLMILRTSSTEAAQRVDYVIPSINLDDITFFSLAGAGINDLFYIYQNVSLLEQATSTRFVDVNKLLKYTDETYVNNFVNDTILPIYGPEVQWTLNETYPKFHKQIGD
jgi:hypothetical protein